MSFLSCTASPVRGTLGCRCVLLLAQLPHVLLLRALGLLHHHFQVGRQAPVAPQELVQAQNGHAQEEGRHWATAGTQAYRGHIQRRPSHRRKRAGNKGLGPWALLWDPGRGCCWSPGLRPGPRAT